MAYFANSSEGMILDNQCASCEFEKKECPISIAQTIYNYEAANSKVASEILNCIVDNKNGCLMFLLLRIERGENKDKIIERLTARVNELEAGQQELGL